jgi:hypothetical protein
MARPDIGMPGKGGTSVAGVNIRTRAVFAGIVRAQDERGLGIVEFPRNRLHLRGLKSVGIEDNGKLVFRRSGGW